MMHPKNSQVVYTCLFGYSEKFADVDYADAAVDYVCFTDDPELRSEKWRIIHAPNFSLDPARLAKRHKHLPHIFLPDYQRSIYIDNTVRLKMAPSTIFDRYAADEMVMLRHPHRACAYDEGVELIRRRYDDPETIKRQMQFYRELGYPDQNGLNAGTFLLRDHRSPEMRQTIFDWHSQVLRFSHRDQLSWNFCAWLNRFQFTSVDEDVYSNSLFDWPIMASPARIPRDFIDSRYLELNPDVKRAGMNPRKHYLFYGFRENRRHR